jgi:hypothetical protein
MLGGIERLAGTNSSPAKFRPIMVWPEPLDPCSTNTGSPVGAPIVM